MSEVLETGTRRCPTCRLLVAVLYDHQARWAFCPACGYTIPPRHLELTAKDRDGLIRTGMKRLKTDGFLPGPYRSPRELGQDAGGE